MQLIFSGRLLRASILRGTRQLVHTMQPLATHGENVVPEQPLKVAKMDNNILRVKKLSDNATLPVSGSACAAGYDLAR
jgi:hypothetical protein